MDDDTLGFVDTVCRYVSGLVADDWSPVEAITDPLIGNWNALKQKGEALIVAGEAAETAASNLTTSLGTLEPHRNGGAAQSFHGYLTKLAAALDYEGALARVVSKVYDGVAYIVEWVTIGAIKALSLGGRDHPQVHAGQRADLRRLGLLRRAGPRRPAGGRSGGLGGGVELLPGRPLADYAEGELQEQFEPLREQLSAPEVEVDLEEAPSDLLNFGEDLGEVADTDTLSDAPTDSYEAGAHPRRTGS